MTKMDFKEIIMQSMDFTAGCTEPAAIAYCASLTGKHIQGPVQSIVLDIDQRTYKNAFGAGIPGGEGHKGSVWAVVLGFVAACPEERLAIFSRLTPEIVKQAEELIEMDVISVNILEKDTLYIGVSSSSGSGTVKAVIQDAHTNVTELSINGHSLETDRTEKKPEYALEFDPCIYNPDNWKTIIQDVYDSDALKLKIRTGIEYNMDAAEYGKKYLKTDNVTDDGLVLGAIFARMSGDPIPVMSCAGSGNKGLTCIIPVIKYAREHNESLEREEMAAVLSCLLTTVVTSRFGAVSSICGAQYAAGAGIIAGILYLKGRINDFPGAYNNFISAVGGGFCDGAKGSCSMRGNVAVMTAKTAISHVENGFIVSGLDGFLGQTFEETLNNMAKYNPLIAKFESETIEILKNK